MAREKELGDRLEQALAELRFERKLRDKERQRSVELQQKVLTGGGDPDEAQRELVSRVERALAELEQERKQRDDDCHAGASSAYFRA